MNIVNNNDDLFNDFLRISQHVKQNFEEFMQNPIIKNIIDNSEDIIDKYSDIWYNFDYYEVISCYIALLCIYFKVF